jgi:hypothetical protein
MIAPFRGFLVKKSTTFPIEYANMSLGINRKRIKSRVIELLKGIFFEIKVQYCLTGKALNSFVK